MRCSFCQVIWASSNVIDAFYIFVNFKVFQSFINWQLLAVLGLDDGGPISAFAASYMILEPFFEVCTVFRCLRDTFPEVTSFLNVRSFRKCLDGGGPEGGIICLWIACWYLKDCGRGLSSR